MAGYSPSVRLFEAAACGATIVSDNWEGIDTFLRPGREILLPKSSEDVVAYLKDMNRSEIRRIGRNAQERVLAEHTSEVRAIEFENHVGGRAKSVSAGAHRKLSMNSPKKSKLMTPASQ